MQPQASLAIRPDAYWRPAPTFGRAARLIAGAAGTLLLSLAPLAALPTSVLVGASDSAAALPARLAAQAADVGDAATRMAATAIEVRGATPDAAPHAEATFTGAGCRAIDCCC
jgi:hypothetical protein